MKNMIKFLVFFVSSFAFCQVGIGTNSPNTNAILDLTASDKALLLPRVANTASVLSSINGMIIYDISQNCVRAYENGSWSNCFAGFTFPSISALDCNGSINNGTLTDGVAASSVSSIISYTGGNGSTHTGQIVTSTGVAGLTATLTAGNFATGAGTLTYNITGTPSGVGTASFAINIGGKTCSLTRTVVAPITIPATITLASSYNQYTSGKWF